MGGNIYESQIDRMKELIGYGINEKVARESTGIIEYQAKGADGKTYGIIREGQKYYIKVAPKKNTELLAEDFDYVGGFMNKKRYEYLTYPMASKQLELKLMSINEACNSKKPVIVEGVKNTPSEWQVNETKEMRAELDRYNEIVNNVSYILKEDKNSGFTMNHTLPEAPAKNPSDKKVNAPFTDTAVAKLDKDLKDTQTNPEKAGAPYTKDGKVSSNDMKSDKKPTCNGGDTYCEKPQYVDTGVAGMNPSGGKVTRVESKNGRTVIMTEEQVLAWNKSKDFMDKSNGTEIGSSAPYTDQVEDGKSNQGKSPVEHIHEEAPVVHNTDNQNSPEPGTNEKGDGQPFTEKVNEEIDVSDVAGMDDEDDVPFPEAENDMSAGEKFDIEFNDWENSQNDGINPYDDDLDIEVELDPSLTNLDNNPFKDDFEGEFSDDYLDDDYPLEGIRRRGGRISENTIVLNDFGKHPAYRKKPMTTPPNVEIDKFGRDWNDDSAKGEKPFGSQIGKSDPYTEKVIDAITDSIVRQLSPRKKKV